MEILVDDKNRIVQVWLNQNEKELRAQLKPQFATWKKGGYLTAVYLSGSDDLYRRTSDLLCHNRKRLAELEVQKAKAAM